MGKRTYDWWDESMSSKNGDGLYQVRVLCPQCGYSRDILITFIEMWAMRYSRRPKVMCDPCLKSIGGKMVDDYLEKRPERPV
jgi:hypothetical protein